MYLLKSKGQSSFEIVLILSLIILISGTFFIYLGSEIIKSNKTAKAHYLAEKYLLDKKSTNEIKKISYQGDKINIEGSINKKEKEDIMQIINKNT